MDLTRNSPIRYDFIPIPGSIIRFRFKLRSSKKRAKINIDTNIFYKDPFIIGRIFLINSGPQSIYTSEEDKIHLIEFKIPEFQNRIQSYLNISIDPIGDPNEKVIIEDMRVEVENTVYAKPNESLAVPNIGPRIGNTEELKELVSKGYREILKREPDPIGLDGYINQLKAGLNLDSFYSILRSSEEYKQRFGIKDVINVDLKKELEKFREGQKIAIASIVRDEEQNGNLSRFLDCCKELEQYHKNLIYIFIEGDSSDRTYDVLKEWVGQRSYSLLEKMNRGCGPFGKIRDAKRTIHLAELRNRLIEIILSNPDIGEILIVDANYCWNGDLISSLREANAHIVAPLAVMNKDGNGKYMFYDTWVFRKNGKEFWPLYPYAEDMQFDNPVDVDSVGSCYLLKRQVLDAGVRYDGNRDSEQVGFCNNARNSGFTIKINPKVYIIKGGFKE